MQVSLAPSVWISPSECFKFTALMRRVRSSSAASFNEPKSPIFLPIFPRALSESRRAPPRIIGLV